MRARWRREIDQATASPFVIGSKVRRIDEPWVVLHVRELDPEGRINGTAKVLCFNSYGHGKWMLLTDLEAAS